MLLSATATAPPSLPPRSVHRRRARQRQPSVCLPFTVRQAPASAGLHEKEALLKLATAVGDVTCCAFCGTTSGGLILIVVPADEGFALPTRHDYTLGVCKRCDDKAPGGSIVGRLVMSALRWIVIDATRHLLPLGTKSGHLHLSEELDGTWQVEHVATAANIRSSLTSGRSFERARQFAEAYARACKPDNKSLSAPDAPWRLGPMSEAQRANLDGLGVKPALAMTAGEASDLFQRVKAARALAMSIAR